MDAQLETSGKLTLPGAMNQQDASSFKREGFRSGSPFTDLSSNASSINYRKARQDKIGGDGFWCGVLCMHLPGLSRRRPMHMQQQQSMSLSEADTRASTAGPAGDRLSTVSKAASMERFKYSSSSSGTMFERTDAGEEEEEVSAYFDLPLELLRISSVDTESPVTAAFVFDGNRGRSAKKIVPEIPDLDFSFPAPPVFSNPSSPRS
ncbi:uncharacterized protein [Miscanthus floridulus]|uniref:uncharacterized protein n=1 Tax=Miscanthus floridulus TaxID=154761 RepID=UPI00345A72C1